MNQTIKRGKLPSLKSATLIAKKLIGHVTLIRKMRQTSLNQSKRKRLAGKEKEWKNNSNIFLKSLHMILQHNKATIVASDVKNKSCHGKKLIKKMTNERSQNDIND